MIKYSPFLKLKQNEVQAIESLDDDIAGAIRPLFDIPRTSKVQTEKGVSDRIALGFKNILALFEVHEALEFYVDNIDIDDDIDIKGVDQYRYILRMFQEFHAIPVLAFDRNVHHNVAAVEYLRQCGGKIALRLQREDLESYRLVKPRIQQCWNEVAKYGCEEFHLLLDLRVIDDEADDSQLISSFLKGLYNDFNFDLIVVLGSIIPSNISDLIKTDSSSHEVRKEKIVWDNLVAGHEVMYGDYGVVSPDYSDADLDPRLLRLVATPKVFYPYRNNFFIVRGGSLHRNPKGNGQFFDVADSIVSQSFYRHPPYSVGDKYIFDRSKGSPSKPAKAGSQGSWIKAMLSAHITFIVRTI